MGGETERADAPWSKQKTPCKKNQEEKNIKKYFFVAVAAEPVHGGRAHGEN